MLLSTLILALATGVSGVFAAQETATDVFYGNATTGAGQSQPVEIDPDDVVVRQEDGAIGFGYTYRAEGTAKGSLPGDFSYEEHGYIFFFNPADPSTLAGGQFLSGVFTLDPKKPGPTITIAHTDPASATSGVVVAQVEHKKIQGLPKDATRLLRLIFHKRELPKEGSLQYGVFTFTTEHGTFNGYATPDFREIAIELTFSR